MRQGKLMGFSWAIQSGQRLATGPELNFAYRAVTNYAKPKGRRMVGHNESEGIEPRNTHIAQGQGIHDLEASNDACEKGEHAESCRGLRPWQVIQRITSELGRAVPYPKGATDKLKRQGGGMAARQSDQLIVEE